MSNTLALPEFNRAIVARFKSILPTSPLVPIGNLFFKDWEKYNSFVTYHIRNFGQEHFTGPDQQNVGVCSPIIQVDCFANNIADANNLFNTVSTNLNGLWGALDPFALAPAISVGNSSISLVSSVYDDASRLYQLTSDWFLELNSY
jgi:hypothetical protein